MRYICNLEWRAKCKLALKREDHPDKSLIFVIARRVVGSHLHFCAQPLLFRSWFHSPLFLWQSKISFLSKLCFFNYECQYIHIICMKYCYTIYRIKYYSNQLNCRQAGSFPGHSRRLISDMELLRSSKHPAVTLCLRPPTALTIPRQYHADIKLLIDENVSFSLWSWHANLIIDFKCYLFLPQLSGH